MKLKMIMAGMMMSLFVVPGLLSVAVRADMAEQELAPVAGANVRDASGTHRALLVGINNYDPAYEGVTPLDCCINDALGVRSTILLADPGQRWSDSLIQVLTNNTARASAIRAALQTMATVSQSGDLAIYYHSSHGGQYSGTSVYLCAYDQDYSAVSLGQDLALFNSGVTVIVMVDACHSGGLFKGAGWPFAEMVMRSYTETKTTQYQSRGLAVPKDLGNNIAFMTACDYNQLSQELYPHGLYTGGLINGCLSSAVDLNHDGLYQFSELHTYAAQVASAQNPGQTAQQFHESVLTSMVARSVSGTVPNTPTTGDIDGDRKADLISVVGDTSWYIWFSTAQYLSRGGPYTFNVAGTPLTGDIDGDRLADIISVTGTSWYVWFSTSQYLVRGGPYTFDVAGTPATGDIDGDRLADIISVSGTSWYVWFSTAQYLVRGGPYTFNVEGTPLTGDIDGDRLADIIVVTGTDWYVWFSTAQYLVRGGPYSFNVAGTPLTGDVDGDGLADIIVVTGNDWYVWFSTAQYLVRGGPYTLGLQ